VLVPGIAAEAARVAWDRPDITVISDERDPLSFLSGIGIAALETPGGRVSTGKNGAVWLRYAADASQRTLSPGGLQSGAPLKGAIVVVGLKGDVVKTPLGLTSTANVIGDGIENLAGNTALSRPGWARPAEALVLAALGIAMLLLLRFGLGWAAALLLAATAFLALDSWYLYAAQSVLTDWLTPALFLAFAFVAGAFAWLQDLQSAYDGLRLVFCDSLPPATLRKIARRPELLKMDGETRIVTYLICGLRAADTGNDPAGFTLAIQRALTPLIDQVLSRGGTLDRMTADGFAAFWNAPLDDADHARHACEAAEAMTVMAGERMAAGGVSPVLHAGIATGAVVAGGVAGHGYAVQGEVVALAERILAMAERYAAPLIASEETKRLADRSFAFLEIDAIAGPKNAPIALYALAGNQVVRASPKFRALAVFHDHIFQAVRKQNWRMARDLIGQCRRLSGANQALYDLHLARIAFYEQNLPGADWDGAFRPVLK
jgi:adenylate cyclase